MHRGSLDDLGSLRSAAASSDGVIHCAFIHDFNNYGPAAEADQRAIETLGSALAGSSDRPLVITSGSLLAQRQGPLATGKRMRPIPASLANRKMRRLRWRQAESAPRCCGFPHPSTATVITALFHT